MRPILAACLAALPAFVAPWAMADEVFRYSGLCDASAAVALGRDHFAVADDERNTLVTYKRGQSAPVALLPLGAFLGTAADKESDLEGAAAIGSRTYWISSHGRNKNGKLRKERYRFFSTDVDSSTVPPSLRPVGVPYTGLLQDLLSAEALKRYKLKDAAREAALVPRATDSQIADRIMELAEMYGAPLEEENLTIRRDTRTVFIDASYVQPIEVVPGMPYPWRFAWSMDVFVLPGALAPERAPGNRTP